MKRKIHIEVGLSPLTNVVFICFNKSILKIMKIAFIEIFCPDVYGYAGKQLDKKAKVNFKSQIGKQIIITQVLPKISRSKGNQTMKFGQLSECSMRNIFPEKSYAKFTLH